MSYIKSINSYSRYLTVTNGGSSNNYINNYSGSQGVGNVRFNTSTQNMEVWDGNTWVTLNGAFTDINLSHEAVAILDWAKQKQKEEQELDELCKSHPSVAEAYERLQILKALTKSAGGDGNTKS
jgi:hypothetical protein